MDKSHDIFEKTIFKNSPLSSREAFLWLIDNSINWQLHISLRSLAAIWKWHYSAVKRFLDKLKIESLIEIGISSKTMVISLPETISKTISTQKQNNERLIHTEFESITSTISQQSAQRTLKQFTTVISDENSFCNNAKQPHKDLTTDIQTISEQQTGLNSKQEEEKKKRSKKRKEEEFIKERNIPYGDTKKEKMLSDSFQDLDLENSISHSSDSLKPSKVPVHLVEAKDVKQWAAENLQIDLDLNWELGKFQDYWLSSRKKPPKNGVAAFRNWLRKAMEIKTNNQGDRYDRFNNNKQKTSDFQRFLIGGAGALDELRRDRLDRNAAWEE